MDRKSDLLYLIFWLTFLFPIFFTDPYALDLPSWPPAFMKHLLDSYSQTMDPVFGSGELWHKVCVAIELFVYPPYCLLASHCIYHGLHKYEKWIQVPTIVVTTMIMYSYALIISYNVFGAVKTSMPWMWALIYSPYFVIPPMFAYRVYTIDQKADAEKLD
jgi:hypothetical protein